MGHVWPITNASGSLQCALCTQMATTHITMQSWQYCGNKSCRKDNLKGCRCVWAFTFLQRIPCWIVNLGHSCQSFLSMCQEYFRQPFGGLWPLSASHEITALQHSSSICCSCSFPESIDSVWLISGISEVTLSSLSVDGGGRDELLGTGTERCLCWMLFSLCLVAQAQLADTHWISPLCSVFEESNLQYIYTHP